MPFPWLGAAALGAGALSGFLGHRSEKKERRRREKHPNRGVQKIKAKYKKYETLDKRQKKLQQRLSQMLEKQYGGGVGASPTYQGANRFLQQLYDPSGSAFSAFEAPYKRQFQEEVVPQLAERFSALDAQKSSGFNQALAQAGAGLSERLASLRSGLQMQGLSSALPFALAPGEQAQGLLSTAFHPNFQRQEKYAGIGLPPPQQPSAWASSFAPITGGIFKGIGTGLGERFAKGFGDEE